MKELIIGKQINLLDKGFIRVIDCMGDDSAIVQAARVSYGKGTKATTQDEALIRYLVRHRHTSPLEMCELKIHVKMPIFVARQWIRHRTASLNEISARYSIMNDEFYVPEKEQLCKQSTFNKQGRDGLIDDENSKKIIEKMKKLYADVFKEYEEFINEYDLARELSRGVLPVSLYTEMYWKIDLHNLLHFISLRNHPHAQYEIRVYGEALLDLLKEWVPFVYKAFIDYRATSVFFSGPEKEQLRSLLNEEKVNEFFETSKDLKGEKLEFVKKLKDIFDVK